MQQNKPSDSPQDDYRIHLVLVRVRELEQLILNTPLQGGSQEAVNSYALQQMEYKGALLEARYILDLLTQPIPQATE